MSMTIEKSRPVNCSPSLRWCTTKENVMRWNSRAKKCASRVLIGTHTWFLFPPSGGEGKKTFGFTLVSVHLYYGAAAGKKLRDRFLETMALASWAQKRNKDPNTYDKRIILLGDMNLPATTKKHPMYRSLVGKGLHLPRHASNLDWKGKRMGTNLFGDAPYDQIAFIPKATKSYYRGRTEVFDFDYALFPDLYSDRSIKDFRDFMKYHISDHRLLWGEFKA